MNQPSPTQQKRRLLAVCLTLALPLTLPAQAQPAPQKLEFDVASIRQNNSGPPQSGGDEPRVNIPNGPDDTFRNTGGVYSAINMPLNSFIAFAYKITTSQRAAFRASLPEWALTEGFNLEARTDNQHVTKDEMRLMMQSLLADRFKLVIHKESRDVPVYAVVLVKPGALGPQLRPHPTTEPCTEIAPPISSPGPDAPPPPPRTLPNGFPAICHAFDRIAPNVTGLRREGSRDMPIPIMVTAFSGLGNLGRPAIDKTGLIGTFDWVIEFLQEIPGQENDPQVTGPSFQEALKDQLGLKLVPQKAPFDFILVDHVEHPTGN
jgi:uncharacterized protein (TIGR03435 family)